MNSVWYNDTMIQWYNDKMSCKNGQYNTRKSRHLWYIGYKNTYKKSHNWYLFGRGILCFRVRTVNARCIEVLTDWQLNSMTVRQKAIIEEKNTHFFKITFMLWVKESQKIYFSDS